MPASDAASTSGIGGNMANTAMKEEEELKPSTSAITANSSADNKFAMPQNEPVEEAEAELDELNLSKDGEFESFGHYMHAKIRKLDHQVHDGVQRKSNLFRGISIYVNGYTDPPALELRRIIVDNGGEYHHYYQYGRTTYAVATHLAKTKMDKLRKDEKYISPKWIMDSLAEGALVPDDGYLLNRPDNARDNTMAIVEKFFDRSRLHLISTLSNDVNTLVSDWRDNVANHHFASRARLPPAVDENAQFPTTICHIDMDCFFASVALRTRPEFRGKPVAVTHAETIDGRGTSEIATCTYEARDLGVRKGMWIRDAKEKCPQLVVVPYEFEEYRETARQVYETVSRYTLDIQSMSCDEMYIDLTRVSNELHVEPHLIAAEIRKEILEVTQCPATAGLGPNKLVARLATKAAKQARDGSGVLYIAPNEVLEFMKGIKVADIPGVGHASLKKLHEELGGVETCGDILRFPKQILQKPLGNALGDKVWKAARGKTDERIEFSRKHVQKNVSVDMNYSVRCQNAKDLCDYLEGISVQVSNRMKERNYIGCHLTLKLLIRHPDAPVDPDKFGGSGWCNQIVRSCNIHYTCEAAQIHATAVRIARELAPEIADVRGLNITMTKLKDINEAAKSDLRNYFGVKRSSQEVPGLQPEKPKLFLVPLVLPPKAPRAPRNPTKSRKFPAVSLGARARPQRLRKLGQLPKVIIPGEELQCTLLQGGQLRIGQSHFNVELDLLEEPDRQTMANLLSILEFYLAAIDVKSVTRAMSFLERHVGKTERGVHAIWPRIVSTLKMELNQMCFEQAMQSDELAPHLLWPSLPPAAYVEYMRAAAEEEERQKSNLYDAERMEA